MICLFFFRSVLTISSNIAPTNDNDDINTAHVRAIKSQVLAHNSDLDLKSLSEKATKDENYQKIIKMLQEGKTPNDMPDHHPSKLYKDQWQHLHFDPHCDLLLYHSRIVVPDESRPEVLKTLHLQHLGKTYTKETARSLYFWPGMNNNIDQMIEKCLECMKFLPSQQKEPLIQTIASRPFEKVSTDLYQIGQNFYLILADRYSGWPEVARMKKTATSDVTNELQQWFIQHGKPLEIRHDGGPNVDSDEFDKWCNSQGIKHDTSSAHYPQSNGHAEATVKSMKYLLQKHNENWDTFQDALREWRNTKRSDGLSPAEWYLGRRQRTHAAAHPSSYERINDASFAEHESRRQTLIEKSKLQSDKHSRPLPKLTQNSKALLQNPKTKRWDRPVTITEIRPSGSYWVTDDYGGCTLRNRRFLRPIGTSEEVPAETISQPSSAPVPPRRSSRLAPKNSASPHPGEEKGECSIMNVCSN